MDNFAKRPYEISLWDEQLIWERRKLEQVENLEEEKYAPGKYYSENSEALGQVSYTLDFGEYAEGRKYYILSSKEEDFIRGESPSHVETPEDWGDAPSVINSYYKEYKLCTIGSDTMEAPFRAVNGKFVTKINGENTLNFSVYYQYMDLDSGQLQINPFLPYLSNERKVKLRIGAIGSPDCKWYDLIIKQVQENSETKAFQYTCKDLFVSELSKSGFELEFDSEQENNIGTVTYLGENILSGSDWRVGKGNSTLHQYIEEPLYEVKLVAGKTITATDMLKGDELLIVGTENERPTVLVFYSHINEEQTNLQFLYDPDGTYKTDDNLIIDKDRHSNYIIKGASFNEGRPDWAESCILSEKYRGMRLVRQAQSKYDSTIDRYVSVYEKENSNGEKEIYYGFTKDEYLSPQAVFNYIVNPNSFTSTDGWVAENTINGRSMLSVATYPPLGNFVEGGWQEGLKESKTYLAYKNVPGANIMNTSISNYRSAIGSLKKNDQWVIRLKNKVDHIGGPDGPNDQGEYDQFPPGVRLAKYLLREDGSFDFGEDNEGLLATFWTSDFLDSLVPNDIDEQGKVFKAEDNPKKINYIYLLGTINRDVSQEELQDYGNRFGLFIERKFATNDYFIEDIELFPLVTYTKDNEERFCVPGGEFFSETRTDYYYYKPNKDIKDVKELTYESTSEGKPDSSFTPVYNDSEYTKVRSITGKESNRFNLLQDLCEKFECWIKYDVRRDKETGEILLGMDTGQMDGDEAYRQQKFIVFKEYLRDEYNWAGFRYGVNEKSIRRTIDSNQIVSKMIVKNNANEFATDGSCSIARAEDNDIKENFLLNFDHYYQHKLLNLATVTNDLYLDSNGYIGYYKLLREKNAVRDALIEKQANLLIDLMHYDSMVQMYGASYQSALEEKQNIEIYIQQLTGSSFKAIADGFDWSPVRHNGRGDFDPKTVYYDINLQTGEYYRTEDEYAQDGKSYATNELYAEWDNNKEFLSHWAKYCQVSNIITQHGPIYEKVKIQLNDVQARYDAVTVQLDQLRKEKQALNLRFYKKYSRFLQEGSWISEDYVDDNLYYLDAKSTLHTSAHPKVTYDINVLELSQLPGYENYKFELGDRTYIEDPEFFGYSLKDGVTPYREEIVVNEISIELDAPEKNSIKVQNYKTQFDDLFSRITASTQQLEYHSGGYQRAANVVEQDGTIAAESLEKSFQKNAIALSSAKDQSVVIDSYGITTSSLSKPDQMVRIISGGIYISNDGGQTWRTGITGAGVNTSVLTSGQLNTKEILITSGDSPSFRWNQQGINAFYINPDDLTYDPARFVRFDQYGIYGVNGSAYHKFDVAEENSNGKSGEERIWDEAQYALTWKGFMLKRKGADGGYVSISSEDDFVVHDKDRQRIKIGNIGSKDNPNYGIELTDVEGNTVMRTDENGSLLLTNKLSIEFDADNGKVAIGNLQEPDHPKDERHGSRVIDANNEFVVYEDGFMKATGAYFDGEINATGGFIGQATVDSVSGTVTQVSAAINNTTLSFSENGLTLGAGDLVIQKKTFEELIGDFEEGVQYYVKNDSGYEKSYDKTPVEGVTYYYPSGTEVFYADDDGNLTISGTLDACNGKFTGEVTATEGAIGGLKLEGGILYGDGHQDFYLDGANGELGIDTAYVYDKIYLQETKNDDTSLRMVLKRPDADDPTVLSTANISLAANGVMTLGSEDGERILFSAKDGQSPYIGHINKDGTAGSWTISGTGHASFQDITADNLHVLNSTLENGNVQAVGGVMVFKDAFTVEEIKTNDKDEAYLLVKGFATFEPGTIIYVGNSSLASNLNEYYQVDRVAYVRSDDTDPISTPQQGIMGGYPKMRIYLKDNAARSFLPNTVFTRIGPNQSNILYALGYDQRQTMGGQNYGTAQKNYDFAFGNSFGVTRINMDPDGSVEYTPRVVLGDLSGVAARLNLPLEGHGLYCDNVWLNGGLIASNGDYTAGIRSNSKKDYEYKDTSGNIITDKVLLWAGAEDTLGGSLDAFENEIAKARFLVTQGGYVHASLGEFTNGVISNSEIHGSNIYSSNLYTVNIHGYNKETKEKVGLNIYDLAYGITFKRDEKEAFSIGDAGFFAGAIKENPFIDFSEDFTGASFWSGDSENRNIGTRLLSTGLEHLNENHLKVSAINMRENGEIQFHNSTDAYAVFSSAKATFYTPVVYENNKGYLQYLVNDLEGGYDLYVFSKNE